MRGAHTALPVVGAMRGGCALPALSLTPSARLAVDMAPDGPAGELTRGWVDEPGDFLGLEYPDGPEVGVVLPEPQPPIGADDR